MPPIPLDNLLGAMIDKEASDLYLSAGSRPKFSLHGHFSDAAEVDLTPRDTKDYAMQVLNEEQREELRKELEINVSYAIAGKGRFRINVFTQRGSHSLVIRRINIKIPRFDELNLPPSLGAFAMGDRGMVLVTGATGSGKSTTLAAMIDHRNENKGGHIVTIEDPLEFVHRNKKSLISQREVGIDTKSFYIALKNTLRQAPNVIFIGEIRDSETMDFAIHASETGHLVFATLHSTNASQTLERILGFFSHDQHEQLLLNISLNLKAIVSQRLIPRIGGGRVPALEILINTPYIMELITKGEVAKIRSAIEASAHEGLQTFDMHIHQLWSQGLVSEEDAFRFADSANNLRLRMRGIAVGALVQ